MDHERIRQRDYLSDETGELDEELADRLVAEGTARVRATWSDRERARRMVCSEPPVEVTRCDCWFHLINTGG